MLSRLSAPQVVIGVCLMALGSIALADSLVLHTIPIHNGPNDIDLDGDSEIDQVFVAWRDNGNAHGFDQVLFFRKTTKTEHLWELVPFFNRVGDRESAAQQTRLGADCALRAVVLLRTNSESAPVAVLVADRDFAGSYVDAEQVTFTFYELARNVDGIAGWPSVYWSETRSIKSSGVYCDVKHALRSELGVSLD